MCWKKLFGGGSVDPVIGDRIFLHFAIDDWPGSQNDLPDCVIDQNNIVNFIKKNYPEFQIRTFKNSEVTRANFANRIKKQIQLLKPGDKFGMGYSGHGTKGTDPYGIEVDKYSEALFLYDGAFWDREFSALLDLIPDGADVLIALDSCFAKGSTVVKLINSKPLQKARYMPIQELKPGVEMARSYLKNNMKNYAVFAACQENQTSSSTGYGGVFTLNWIKAWQRSFTNQKWSDETARFVKLNGEAQVPNIDGDPRIINKIIFS